MSLFDTILIVDWSAGLRAPKRPSKDAIWIGIARDGQDQEPIYCRSRHDAEAWLSDTLRSERAAGRRVLAGFDFPFGYPKGVARMITGSDDPFALWDWLECRIEDDTSGRNNRFAVAEQMNARFVGPGPFWGKTSRDDWPGLPYRKTGILYDTVAERRACDLAARAASSCFQLAFPPTVGSQILMGLPVLNRLRRDPGAAIWPFEQWRNAPVVLAEIWPGLIESVVRDTLSALAAQTGSHNKKLPSDATGTPAIRDRIQVQCLARAVARLQDTDLGRMLDAAPPEAAEEAWILGTGWGPHLTTLAAPIRDPDRVNTPDRPRPPPLKNDCFALPPGVDWTPVDDALALLRARLHPVTPVDSRPVADALGLVLAADIQAFRANPPEPNTAVDGYGFASAATGDGEQILPLVDGRSAAGAPFSGTIPAGYACRVLTGAALPPGVDTVVLDEDSVMTDGHVAFRGPIKPGANTRRAGEDVAKGATALHAGRVLTPADLALASAIGVATLPVHRRLRVAVLSTGDELVDAGDPAATGQIFDANRPMLLAMIARMGFSPLDLGRVPDDRAALRVRLDQAAESADLILTSGGASAGDEDHVSALLRETGALQEWRIALKPGRPLALGMWSGVPVFGLPGNPVAAFTCTLIFARPAMTLLSGAGWSEPQGFSLPAAFEKQKKPGRREFLRARIRDGRAEVFHSEGSGRVSGLSWAEGLVELADGAAHVRPGDPVRFIPFGSFGL